MAENPPVVPSAEVLGGYGGMTLRDWFAGQIATGMASYSGTQGIAYGPGEIAERSYKIADAMLTERTRDRIGGGE